MLAGAVLQFPKDNGIVQCGCVGAKTLDTIMKASKVKAVTPANTIPTELKPYLQPSNNCQSTDPAIVKMANQVIGNETNLLKKATLIFNWVRDNTDWIFYLSTKLGALGLLNKRPRTANCTDMGHLLVALWRAAGVPARYMHVYTLFKSGYEGHTVAQAWINGAWLDGDATDNDNTLGHDTNWEMGKYSKVYGYYQQLPY